MISQKMWIMAIGLPIAMAMAVGGCQLSPGVACGDGWCSDGEICSNHDPAKPMCLQSTCGNGILDPGEECDNGKLIDGDGCSSSCKKAVCGNGIRDYDEECDGTEGCSATCKLEGCGNGIPDPGEQCDDHNRMDGDGCSAHCTKEVCGNGIVDAGEQCDDHNMVDGDGCSATCQLEHCGNGVIDTGEECDGAAGPQPCSAGCHYEHCGNNQLDPGEQCDPPNPGNGCSATCQFERCGNGTLDPEEECDPPSPGNGCSAICLAEHCGNGILDPDEECDLGPANSDTGNCTTGCKLPTCGDGHTWDGHEQCDDGANNGTDGTCSASCTRIACNNGILDPGEVCDDGNMACGACGNDCKTITSQPATGLIVATAGIQLSPSGNTFTLGDGTTPKTFELTTTTTAGSGNVKITFKVDDSAATIADKIATAIAGTTLDITATSVGDVVLLRNKRSTTAGNQPSMTNIPVASGFVVSDMANALGGDCMTDETCTQALDCLSNACVNDKCL